VLVILGGARVIFSRKSPGLKKRQQWGGRGKHRGMILEHVWNNSKASQNVEEGYL
jgi:hypothetical protein